MTKYFVAHRLVIDYSLIIGNNQWLINWSPIDYLSITQWLLIDYSLISLMSLVSSSSYVWHMESMVDSDQYI